MKILMLAYPGMTLLDLVGPLQAWSAWPGNDIHLVWKDAGPLPTDTGLDVVATHDFAHSHPTPDILFVPGGSQPTRELMGDTETTDFLAARGARAAWVTSVCTGALVLGAAGLLNGYKATTHWSATDELAPLGATYTKGRWVMDRNRVTGGGVTAGIDFGLALIGELAGEEMARAVQLALEYAPQPPFKSGTPEDAWPETVALVQSLLTAEQASAQ